MGIRRPVEGADFGTYQPGDRYSGWNWYCAHCNDGRGWRWNRVDARNNARAHVDTEHRKGQ